MDSLSIHQCYISAFSLPDSSITILALFPLTWKAITHQANKQGWKKAPTPSNHTPRRRWEPVEERKANQLYEAGSPVLDIAYVLGRSYSAILQRAW